MELNRSQIHALGSRVREAYGDGTGKVADEDLRLLQDYRTSYKDTIAAVFKILYAEGMKVDRGCIVTYRIKRINSIIEKLKRYPDSPLDRLVDIAGCRCIVQDTERVYRVLEQLQKSEKITIHRIKDYIQQPQAEGYKSLHVYVKLSDGSDQQVEIQLRDREMHNWATLLEISDTIIDEARLKEYNTPKDLLEFHRLLSLPMENWKREEKKLFFGVLKRYDYINKLQKIFVQNSHIRYNWMTTDGSLTKSYYLIQYNADYQTRISSYQTFKEAEEAYFKCFVDDGNSNVVLTQIPKANFSQISMAYSNYVLSTHQFVADIMTKLLREIKAALQRKDLDSYGYFLDIYFNALANQVAYLQQDYDTLSRGQSEKKIQHTKTHDCMSDIKDQCAQIRKKQMEIVRYYRIIDRHLSLFYLRAKYVTRHIARKYNFEIY